MALPATYLAVAADLTTLGEGGRDAAVQDRSKHNPSWLLLCPAVYHGITDSAGPHQDGATESDGIPVGHGAKRLDASHDPPAQQVFRTS